MKAKKSYGQHFLVHDHVAERIAEALPTRPDVKKILEVGPGQGKLTEYLLQRVEDLYAVEADRDMVAILQEKYPQLIDKIIQEDFLKLDLMSVMGSEPFYLIGNYPYNISSQIVFKMMDHKEFIPYMVGMFQKEVADRIISPPGSKVYGVISVLVQAYYSGHNIMKLKPGHFNPPPKVDSAVIALERKPEEEWIKTPYEIFRKIVKSAFGMRRKMLRNSLAPFFSSEYMSQHDIFMKRPEKLSVEDFDKLGQEYLSHD